MTSVLRLLRLLAAAACAAIGWLLATSLPSLPAWAELTSAAGIEQGLAFLAWLGCLLLAIGLAYQLARAGRAPVVAAPLPHLRPRRHGQRLRPLRGGYARGAFPLTIRAAPEEQPPAPAAADARAAEVAETAPSPSAHRDGRAAISLLGPPAITGLRRQGRGLRGGTRELLFYLALHPGGAHREQIVDALWPDLPPEQARSRLWRAAADARTQLGEAGLRRDGEHYRLERGELDVDLDRLERLLEELAGAGEQQLPLLEGALALFRGEPLAGVDLPWAEGEQRRLQALRLDLLERTARALLERGQAAAALARAEQGLAGEPYNEKLARLAMQAEAALGLRSAVIDRYERLRETLQEQLGLEPHSETKRLYRLLLGQDDPAVAAPR